MNRAELRRQLCAGRRLVTPAAARLASLRAGRLVWKLQLMQRAKRIAAYFSVGGELDCTALIQQAWARGRQVYLPVLHGRQLRFRRYAPTTRTAPNRFGIPEPLHGEELPATALDVAITPLVAFDPAGNRLGMGGGFYDRTFQFLRHRDRWRHPRLVGFAYDMQCVTHIDSRPWDVPLDGAVTESTHFFFAV